MYIIKYNLIKSKFFFKKIKFFLKKLLTLSLT
nr:MAG TPA: hypothetical protein [Caudoviricetes sp.]